MSSERGMFRALDLNAAQRDKIRALRQGEREKMRAQRVSRLHEMQQLHEEKNKVILAKDFNPKAAQLLAQKMVNEQAKIRAERQIERRVEKMRMQHDMMSILTPAQQVKWEN
ncbi:Spy/CpxP family protein refolding chaperone [Vibrio sp. PP-XX7]